MMSNELKEQGTPTDRDEAAEWWAMVIEAVHRAADNGKYHVYEEKGIRRVTKEEYEASGRAWNCFVERLVAKKLPEIKAIQEELAREPRFV